jgi:hypothetical protein
MSNNVKSGRAGRLWRRSVWESFARDESLRREHGISEAEMKALERVSMMGEVMSKDDFLFILNVVRGGRSK